MRPCWSYLCPRFSNEKYALINVIEVFGICLCLTVVDVSLHRTDCCNIRNTAIPQQMNVIIINFGSEKILVRPAKPNFKTIEKLESRRTDLLKWCIYSVRFKIFYRFLIPALSEFFLRLVMALVQIRVYLFKIYKVIFQSVFSVSIKQTQCITYCPDQHL